MAEWGESLIEKVPSQKGCMRKKLQVAGDLGKLTVEAPG